MTKSQLMEALSERRDLSRRAAEAIVDTMFQGMSEALARGEKIEIRGFGTFKVKN